MGKSVLIILGAAGALGVVTTGWTAYTQAWADAQQITSLTCSEAHAISLCPKEADGQASAPACPDVGLCGAALVTMAAAETSAGECGPARRGPARCEPLPCDPGACDPLTCDPTDCSGHGDEGCLPGKCPAHEGKNCPPADCPGHGVKDAALASVASGTESAAALVNAASDDSARDGESCCGR